MKKNLLSKALTLCLAVVLCLGMLAGCGGKQLTPKELFDLTVNNEEKEINDGVITMYGSSLDAMTAAEGTTVGVKISLGDAARQLLGTATQGQVSFDWLKEIGLSFGSKLDKGVSSNQVGISLNGTELAKVNAVLDTQNEKAFFSVPELLSDALSLDIKAMMEKTGASLPVDLKSVMDLKSWLPDQAVLKSLTDKYTKLVLSNITDIVKEDATVDAGGLSQKCSKLTTTIGADTAKKIASAVADAAEKDTEFAGVLDKIGKVMGFTSSEVLPEIVKSMRDTEDLTGELKLVLYADDKGNAVGLEANGTNSETDENYTMKFYAPEQDGKTALSMEMSNGEQKVTVTGSGTKANNATEGTYAVAVNGDEILTIGEKTTDLEKAKKGIVNGTYTIKAGKALAELMGSNPVASLLTQFSVKMDVAMADAGSGKAAISLVDNTGNDFAAISLDQTKGWSGDASIATDKAVDVTDPSSVTGLLSKVDFNGLVEKLKSAGVPEQLTQAISMIPYLLSGNLGASAAED